jgi:endonuclease/exonuclease/phosphatase family metal-dependent hydrolase
MSLRVVTYNIQDDGAGREEFILEVLRTIQPDVAILQEVGHPNTAGKFAQALNMGLYFAQGNSIRHLALLSRLPISAQHSYHPSPPIHTTILEASIEYAPDQHLRVFGVHLIAQPFITFELWRQREVKTLLQSVLSYHSDLCLIAGDFNAIAPRDPVIVRTWPRRLKLMLALQGGHIFRRAIQRVLSAGFTDCYRMLHPNEEGFTLPTPTPNTRLDYIFANNVLVNYLYRCAVIREPSVVERGSDHYPVMAEFDL